MTTKNNSHLISVSIVDDHQLFAKGLSQVINTSDIAHVKDEYYTLQACRDGLAKSLPDILLIDIELSDGDGVDFCAEITKTYP